MEKEIAYYLKSEQQLESKTCCPLKWLYIGQAAEMSKTVKLAYRHGPIDIRSKSHIWFTITTRSLKPFTIDF